MPESRLLKDILSTTGLTQLDRILIILSTKPHDSFSIKDIKQLGLIYGIRSISKWNISSHLANSNGKAIRTTQGWEITSKGIEYVKNNLKVSLEKTPQKQIISTLRNHLSQIQNQDTQNFLEEAIKCYEYNLFRSAVVLSWTGAISVLYDYVIANKLSDFNAECTRRNSKWKPAKTKDDLGRLKESDFLGTIAAISIIGKNVKQELENCLKLRNSCGHPNSLQISDNRVAAHIEILILNVFSKFP